MSKEMPDPLEQMRADWQQTKTPPLSVEAVKRRLRWRWLFAGFDALALLFAGGIMIWAATIMSGLLEWIYWSFFFLMLLLAVVSTVQWRLRALWRSDDSIEAVIEHGYRDARLRQKAGKLTIWATLAIAVFVAIWMVVAGWLDPLPLSEFLGKRFYSLVFAAVWCLFAAAVGAWMRERGLRQQMELDHLERELRE
ncbi:MAG: hypothetical protein AAGJ52_10900 [Pseudomonadota bacterium]